VDITALTYMSSLTQLYCRSPSSVGVACPYTFKRQVLWHRLLGFVYP